jgi:hypothetical protein
MQQAPAQRYYSGKALLKVVTASMICSVTCRKELDILLLKCSFVVSLFPDTPPEEKDIPAAFFCCRLLPARAQASIQSENFPFWNGYNCRVHLKCLGYFVPYSFRKIALC